MPQTISMQKGYVYRDKLQVDDLHSASRHMEDLGIETLGGEGPPRWGAESQLPTLLLHPKDNMGVLVELQQAN
jgi:hypothetical protein